MDQKMRFVVVKLRQWAIENGYTRLAAMLPTVDSKAVAASGKLARAACMHLGSARA